MKAIELPPRPIIVFLHSKFMGEHEPSCSAVGRSKQSKEHIYTYTHAHPTDPQYVPMALLACQFSQPAQRVNLERIKRIYSRSLSRTGSINSNIR